MACFLNVLVDEIDDAVDKRVLEALLDRGAAPNGSSARLRVATKLQGFGKLGEAVSGIRPAVEQHILNALQQIGRYLLINLQLSRVDDAHIQPGADGVI